MPGPPFRPTSKLRRRPWANTAGSSITAPNGGLPLPPVSIPFSWIATPLTRKPTIAITKAQISQANGPTAYSSATPAIVRQYGANTAQVTLDTACDADPENLATFLTTYESVPRPRQPTLTLNLLARTDAECLIVLGVELGQRVQITGAPAGTPAGALDFIVEGISHTVAVEQRTVTWATAANIGTGLSVVDTFTRSLSANWGTTDTGQPWGATGSDLSVVANRGRITHTTTGNTFNTLTGVAGLTDVTAQMTMKISTKLTGAGAVFPQLLVRFVAADRYYSAGLYFQASGGGTGPVGLVLGKVVGGSFFTLFSNLSFDVYNGSEDFTVKVRCQGTTLMIKAWRSASAEPVVWTATVDDSAIPSGSVAVVSSKEAGVTSVDPYIEFDDLSVSASGANPAGTPGPWFRLGTSSLGGPDLIPF